MKHKLVKQHNAITSASYEMTALEKNIMYLLLSRLRDNDDPKKVYSISVKEIKQLTGTTTDHEQFKKATNLLIDRVLLVNTGKKNFLDVSLLFSGEYVKGKGIIELELSKEIRSFFFSLKNNFTTFQLYVALGLKSKYAKRIYEMLNQYKSTGFILICNSSCYFA